VSLMSSASDSVTTTCSSEHAGEQREEVSVRSNLPTVSAAHQSSGLATSEAGSAANASASSVTSAPSASTASADEAASTSKLPVKLMAGLPTASCVVYRNVFSLFQLRLPAGVAGEDLRVYVDSNCGYSGKAKRFKALPDAGEAAFVVSINLLLPNGTPVVEQCLECFEYFRRVELLKTNPQQQKAVLLVKNNLTIKVVNGVIELRVKALCASAHHGVEAYVADIVVSDSHRTPLCRQQLMLKVKQWKKGGAPIAPCALTMVRM